MAESKKTAEPLTIEAGDEGETVEKMNNPLVIPAGSAIEEAMQLIDAWLKPLNLLGLADRVFYKWMLFRRKPGVTFQFVKDKDIKIHPRIRTEGDIITVGYYRILQDKVPPNFSQSHDVLKLKGYGVEDAIRGLIPKIGFDEREKKTISRLIMSEWVKLPGNRPDIPVRFDYNADDRQIDVMKESHSSISPIPFPEN